MNRPAVDKRGAPKEGSMERQRRLYKEHGLVQINVWIPKENRDELMQDCARLRHQHLKHTGYYARDKDEK